MKTFQAEKGEELASNPAELLLYVAESDGKPDPPGTFSPILPPPQHHKPKQPIKHKKKKFFTF